MGYLDIEKPKKYKERLRRYFQIIRPRLIVLFILILVGVLVFVYMRERVSLFPRKPEVPAVQPPKAPPPTKEEVLESMSAEPQALPDPYRDLTEEKKDILESMSAPESSYNPSDQFSEETKKILEGMSGN